VHAVGTEADSSADIVVDDEGHGGCGAELAEWQATLHDRRRRDALQA
jgi:hypothetical protein